MGGVDAGAEPTVYRQGSARLLIGSAEDAADEVVIDINDIAAVVDMTAQSGVDYADRQDGVASMRFATKDWQTYVEQAASFIDKHLDKGASVLVHCVQGCKGAGSLSIAYLMKKTGAQFEEAYKSVQAQRPCVDQIYDPQNEAFLTGLQALSGKHARGAGSRGEL